MNLTQTEKKNRLQNIRDRIQSACVSSARSPDQVQLIAVSKTKPWHEVADFLSLGQLQFGENYMQEALAKIESSQKIPSSEKIQWHFIGSLQSNKAKFLPKYFQLFHSLNSLKLAKEIEKHAIALNKTCDCLIEVNVDREPTKHGIAPEELPFFLEQLASLSNVNIRGLMCLPNSAENPSRAPFSFLRETMELANKNGAYPRRLHELSMGMSGDFELAILEGATYIRVGTYLFGERN